MPLWKTGDFSQHCNNTDPISGTPFPNSLDIPTLLENRYAQQAGVFRYVDYFDCLGNPLFLRLAIVSVCVAWFGLVWDSKACIL